MENLTSIGVIKEILARHGFSVSKALGQNFLVNPAVCPKIAEYGGNRGVLEIGPGLGVLTAELAKRAEKVAAIELDKRLIPVLRETLADFDNVAVINADVMKADLRQILRENFGDMPVSVCANLPYYITSPVIMKLLESRLPIDAVTVMVQKEAAARLCAETGSRECGAVTAAVRYFSIPEILFDVSRGSFYPAPEVDSAVIRLTIRKEPAVQVPDEEFFFRVVRGAFSQRRKTVCNSISSALGVPKSTAADALRQAGVPENSRPEQLSLEQFAAIAAALETRKEDIT